jgi:hypothetical protein
MANTKPTTLLAVVSLGCSILGWLAILAFLALAERYGELARGSAGVGAVWMGLHIMLAGSLCLSGVLFGVGALVRIRGGEFAGNGKAWTGIILGCLPLALEAVTSLIGNADSVIP